MHEESTDPETLELTPEDIDDSLGVVSRATFTERVWMNGELVPPLLPKTRDQLHGFWNAGLSVLALMRTAEGQLRTVGHAAAEPLPGTSTLEIGVVWTDASVRGNAQNGGVHPYVGVRMYQALLAAHPGVHMFATTINPAAMVVAWRAGMVALRYDQLPHADWTATCCCPQKKTGVDPAQNVPHCKLQRANSCVVQVSRCMWESLGCPTPHALPITLPTQHVPIPQKDGIVLVRRR